MSQNTVANGVANATAAAASHVLVSAYQERLTTAEEPGAEMGPLVTADHLKRVRSYIDLG